MRQFDQFVFAVVLIVFVLLHKQGRIGVTETVDRLFDIAHHVDVVSGNPPDEFILQVIGILILIDQDLVETISDLLCDLRILDDQIDGHMEDVREIIKAAFLFIDCQLFVQFIRQL